VVLLQIHTTSRIRSWGDAVADSRSVGEFADAVGYFRQVLGDCWAGWDKRSPLATVFDPSFQHGPREWVRLYRLIRSLRDTVELDEVVRRGIGSSQWVQYVATVEMLEFCARLVPNGCAVEFIKNASEKTPDARVNIAGRWITIEFKALHEADAKREWYELLAWVSGEIVARGSSLTGLDIRCAAPALYERDAFLQGLIAVKSTRSPTFVQLPAGTGHARYGGPGPRDWMTPVPQASDLSRLINKLAGRWWKQLARAGTPTLIVVRSSMLSGLCPQHDLLPHAASVAAALDDVLQRFPMVGGVLIYDEPFQAPAGKVLLRHARFLLSLGAADGCRRIALLVQNRTADLRLHESEVLALLG
jgi:hypothetical protein